MATYKKGDKVRVLRRDPVKEHLWINDMNYLIGNTYVLTYGELADGRVGVDGWMVHPGVLEKVEGDDTEEAFVRDVCKGLNAAAEALGTSRIPAPDKPGWRPKPGEKCLFLVDENKPSNDAVCVGPDPQLPANHICQVEYENGTRDFLTIHVTHLRPLPVEPPVEVYDIVRVVSKTDTSKVYGQVWTRDTSAHTFTLIVDSMVKPREFNWDEVTITHLIPKPEKE